MKRLIKFLLVVFVVLGVISCAVTTLFSSPTARTVDQHIPTPSAIVLTPTKEATAIQATVILNTPTPSPTNTPSPSPVPVGYISRAMVGEKWPIKDADDGVVRCTRLTGGVQVVTFAANGKTYAVNGSAKTRMNDFGWEDVEAIQNRELNDIGLLKYPITPILDAGLALCR